MVTPSRLDLTAGSAGSREPALVLTHLRAATGSFPIDTGRSHSRMTVLVKPEIGFWDILLRLTLTANRLMPERCTPPPVVSLSPSLSLRLARLPPIRVEESSFSQDMQWLLERGVQFADVAFYAGESGKELGWAHAAVLCAVSPYFRQLLLGPKAR